ncbi:DUF2513 domain-containing protein [Labilibaculum euxinus]
MKRDLDLVKKVLEYFEEKNARGHEKDMEINGFDKDQVSYHLIILFEANLIAGESITTNTGRIYDIIPFRLTWSGHEFLDNIRDNNRWSKIKQIIKAKGGSFSMSLITKLATKLAEDQLFS